MHVTMKTGDTTVTVGVCGECVRATPGHCWRDPTTFVPATTVHQAVVVTPKVTFSINGEKFSLPLEMAVKGT